MAARWTVSASLLLALAPALARSAGPGEGGDGAARCPLIYIDTSFENASPLYWDIDTDGVVQVFLLYDHERSSPNRAAGHWHFQVQAPKGSNLTLVLNNLENIYNGRRGSPASDGTISYVSCDGRNWRPVEM